MNDLRESADKADGRLERKLHYEFTKLRAKGQLRAMFRSNYAPVVPICASSQQDSVVEPPSASITGEKREGLQVDPDHGAENVHGILAILPKGYSHEFADPIPPPLHQIMVLAMTTML